MIFDSNVLIQAAKEPAPQVIGMLAQGECATASVVRIEVYGFKGLVSGEKLALDEIFKHLQLHELTKPVVERAITLRQERKMGLADAIIAATALVHALPLVTRNGDDFKHIKELRLMDPFDPKA